MSKPQKIKSMDDVRALVALINSKHGALAWHPDDFEDDDPYRSMLDEAFEVCRLSGVDFYKVILEAR
jgi:hypothetical protein